MYASCGCDLLSSDVDFLFTVVVVLVIRLVFIIGSLDIFVSWFFLVCWDMAVDS